METKSWYQSKTIWGIGVAVGCAVAGLVGVDLTPQEAVNAVGLDGENAQTVLKAASVAGTVLGGIWGLYGRYKANKAIGSGSTSESEDKKQE